MPESAPTRPASPSQTATTGRRTRRSPVLGVVALVLVPIVIALAVLAPQVLAPLDRGMTDLQLLGVVLTGEVIGMAAVLLLGLVAVITRRGRVPGAIAVVLALLLNPFALSLVLDIVRLLVPAG